MPTTTRNGLPYPASTDAPNGPLQMQQLANAIDTRIVPKFSTNSARSSAITAPADGDMAMVNGYPTFYRSGQWRGIVSTTAGTTTFFATTITDATEAGVATVTVPDPGWPYILDVSAVVGVSADADTWVNVRCRLDTVSGTVISQDSVRSGKLPAGETIMVPLGSFATGTLTGSHSVIVTVRRTLGSGTWNVISTGSLVNAMIRPSFA